MRIVYNEVVKLVGESIDLMLECLETILLMFGESTNRGADVFDLLHIICRDR